MRMESYSLSLSLHLQKRGRKRGRRESRKWRGDGTKYQRERESRLIHTFFPRSSKSNDFEQLIHWRQERDEGEEEKFREREREREREKENHQSKFIDHTAISPVGESVSSKHELSSSYTLSLSKILSLTLFLSLSLTLSHLPPLFMHSKSESFTEKKKKERTF